MIVLASTDLGEVHFLAVRLVVAVVVVERKDIIACGDDHTISEDADSMGGVHIVALVEDRALVGNSVTIGVLQDENTISFGTLSIVAAVVHDLADQMRPRWSTSIELGEYIMGSLANRVASSPSWSARFATASDGSWGAPVAARAVANTAAEIEWDFMKSSGSRQWD